MDIATGLGLIAGGVVLVALILMVASWESPLTPTPQSCERAAFPSSFPVSPAHVSSTPHMKPR